MSPLKLYTAVILGSFGIVIGLAGSEALATLLGLPQYTGMAVFVLVTVLFVSVAAILFEDRQ